jgi:hypothetical protein
MPPPGQVKEMPPPGQVKERRSSQGGSVSHSAVSQEQQRFLDRRASYGLQIAQRNLGATRSTSSKLQERSSCDEAGRSREAREPEVPAYGAAPLRRTKSSEDRLKHADEPRAQPMRPVARSSSAGMLVPEPPKSRSAVPDTFHHTDSTSGRSTQLTFVRSFSIESAERKVQRGSSTQLGAKSASPERDRFCRAGSMRDMKPIARCSSSEQSLDECALSSARRQNSEPLWSGEGAPPAVRRTNSWSSSRPASSQPHHRSSHDMTKSNPTVGPPVMQRALRRHEVVPSQSSGQTQRGEDMTFHNAGSRRRCSDSGLQSEMARSVTRRFSDTGLEEAARTKRSPSSNGVYRSARHQSGTDNGRGEAARDQDSHDKVTKWMAKSPGMSLSRGSDDAVRNLSYTRADAQLHMSPARKLLKLAPLFCMLVVGYMAIAYLLWKSLEAMSHH